MAIEKTKKILLKEEVQILIIPFLKAKDARLSFYSYEMVSDSIPHSELSKQCIEANKEIDYLRLYLKKTLETIEENKEKCQSKDIMLTIDSRLISALFELLPEFRIAPCHFIFNFIEDDYLNQNRLKISNMIKELSKAGFDLCITIKGQDIPYGSIIDNVNYILINQNIIHNMKKTQGNMVYSIFFDNLISKKKTIIASQVPDWATYETLICKKVTIFNGRFLERQNQTTLDINKRILAKMKEIYKKY